MRNDSQKRHCLSQTKIKKGLTHIQFPNKTSFCKKLRLYIRLTRTYDETLNSALDTTTEKRMNNTATAEITAIDQCKIVDGSQINNANCSQIGNRLFYSVLSVVMKSRRVVEADPHEDWVWMCARLQRLRWWGRECSFWQLGGSCSYKPVAQALRLYRTYVC